MKRLFSFFVAEHAMIMAVVAGAFFFVSCNGDNDVKEEQGSVTAIIGDWVNPQDPDDAVRFTDSGTFSGAIGNGSYSISGSRIALKFSDGGSDLDYGFNVLQKDALVLSRTYNDEYAGQQEDNMLYYRRGSDISNASSLSGTWDWMEGEVVGARLKVTGSSFMFIISMWSQKYDGTFTYKNGLLSTTNPAFQTTRDKNGGFAGEDGMNYSDPEKSPWRTPDPDDPDEYQHSMADEVFPLAVVAEGNAAYMSFAGRTMKLVKK